MSEWMLIVKLNKLVWSHGIQSVPRRVRVRIAYNRNDEEDAKEEFLSLVTVAEIPPEGLKGLGTIVFMLEFLFLQNLGYCCFLIPQGASYKFLFRIL